MHDTPEARIQENEDPDKLDQYSLTFYCYVNFKTGQNHNPQSPKSQVKDLVTRNDKKKQHFP